jgi:YtfJ family uncharacterized protein
MAATMKSILLLPLTLLLNFSLAFQTAAASGNKINKASREPEPSSTCESDLHATDNQDSPPAKDHTECQFPEVGESLAVLEIQAGGELALDNDEIVKKPWSSESFENTGKVQVVQYVAANLGVRHQNKAFNDSLKEKKFSSDQLKTTVILNMADSASFTRSIVGRKLAKNKEKYESIHFVIDDVGMGLQRWGMKKRSFAIMVLDANGKVLFAKDGPLSADEVESTITLIENHTT